MEIGRFAFFRPPLGYLEATYDDHLRLIGIFINFPISVNWTFFARCYGWGATGEYRLKIGDFAPTGVGWPNISHRRVSPPPTILLLIKLGQMFFRMVYESGQIFLPFCRNTRVCQTDGRTDGRTDRRTEFSSLDRVCITCSAVKSMSDAKYVLKCRAQILIYFISIYFIP